MRRQRPGQLTAGDSAIATLEPGVLQFFETTIAGSTLKLGEGYLSGYMVPYGVTSTAVYAAMDPVIRTGVGLTGRQVEIEWLAEAGLHDRIIGKGTIVETDGNYSRTWFEAWDGRGTLLMQGASHLTVIRDGKAVPSPLVKPYGRAPLPDPPRLSGHSLIGWVEKPEPAELGHQAQLTVALVNSGSLATYARIAVELPPGGGLGFASPLPEEVRIPAGGVERLTVLLYADRPHEVNLGRPWPVTVTATSAAVVERHTVGIAVYDPNPGRVFYVLTEDCETFDGGPKTGDYGALADLGNQNNVMDPEDYRVQMIEKPARMNAIAERHGAKWTHFWCAAQRFAVDWAAAQSNTGAWPKLGEDLDASIREGSGRHEYSPHIHFDYEPDSQLPPQPRLVYDAGTDGILPNDYWDPETNPRHHWHDWDGSGRGIAYIKELGGLTQLDTKAGSLYKSLRYLAGLQVNARYPLIARTGGFDFGKAPEDQRISTAAYEQNGLRGNSDAYSATELPPRGMYWCDPEERTRSVAELTASRLAQLGVTRETHFSDAEDDNRWFAGAVEAASGPGVGVVHQMAHAMFLRGAPDSFRSLEGGSFEQMDRHLAWVAENYPRVEFATATEALVEYLDYYAPQLEAYVRPAACDRGEDGALHYSIRLLGKGIRVDGAHPAKVRVVAPPWFDAAEVRTLSVLDGQNVLASTEQFSSAERPSLEVELTARSEGLRLAVLAGADHPANQVEFFTEPPEPERPPIFALSGPAPPRFHTDVLRTLMHPIAGMEHPLGRRMHPMGAFPMALAFTAAFADPAGGRAPWKIRLRWRAYCPFDIALRAHPTPVGDGWDVRITDTAGLVIADSEVHLRQVAPKPVPLDNSGSSQALASAKTRAAAAEVERDALRVAFVTYSAEVARTLDETRSQRAWRVMLWVRKAYATLVRGGVLAFLGWLPRSFSAGADLESEEPRFPSSPI